MTKFSKRMNTAEPSIVRELYKAWDIPGMRSLGGGTPDVETFPVKELSAISKNIFDNCTNSKEISKLFSYSITEGDNTLRDILKKRYITGYGIGNLDQDDLHIFTGGQQIIDLTTKCFVNPGDIVLVEEKAYQGAISAFWSYEAVVKGVKTDESGMIPDALEEQLKKNTNVKLIYVVPTFQNPMGIVTTKERRRKIYELAKKYDVMILEDSPYFELRYSGEYVPPIKTLDDTGHVIFAGSLSKILAPGVRLGFCIANKAVVNKLTVGKQSQDMSNPGFLQQLVARYFLDYDMDAHIRDCCDVYRVKRDLMLKCLEKELSGKATWTKPEGGFFLWLTLPENVSGNSFSKYLLDQKKLITVCGSAYCPGGEDINAIRLNFSAPSKNEIEEDVKLIAKALDEFKNLSPAS